MKNYRNVQINFNLCSLLLPITTNIIHPLEEYFSKILKILGSSMWVLYLTRNRLDHRELDIKFWKICNKLILEVDIKQSILLVARSILFSISIFFIILSIFLFLRSIFSISLYPDSSLFISSLFIIRTTFVFFTLAKFQIVDVQDN